MLHSVIHDGVTWHRRPSGHYHNKRRGYLHRYVWERVHGPIPDKHVVHHVDGDPANNDIGNLALMGKSEHQRHHGLGRRTSDAHKSAAAATLDSLRVPKGGTCLQCSAIFVSVVAGPVGRFCSRECREVWRRNKFVPEERSCLVCAGPYLARKRFQRYCSKACNTRSTVRTYRTDKTGGHKRRKVTEHPDVQPDG